jgi:dTDP-4-dehydrorhamnose 3,5-epimerase
MRVKPVETVCDAFVCDAVRYYDHRGSFQELFSHKDLPAFRVSQINCSISKKNVLRGLHVVPFAKLVYCVKGKIFDVVADVRKGSKTYLKWYGVELSGENQKSLFIPPFCGHGFLAMEDDSIVVYAQDAVYNAHAESSVNYADPKLNIKWPNVILSDKDGAAPFLDSCDVES